MRTPIKGHWDLELPRAHNDAFAESFSDAAFEARRPHMDTTSLIETIAKHVAPMRPTALVLTASLWPSAGLDWAALRETAQAAAPCVIWKTATEFGEQNKFNRIALRQAVLNDAQARTAFAGLPIFDAANVTERLVPVEGNQSKWWDVGKIHFRAATGAYRMLNLAFLEFLEEQCPTRIA